MKNPNNKRIVAAVIAVVLALAMVLPMAMQLFY